MDIRNLLGKNLSIDNIEKSLIYLERFINDPKGSFESHSHVNLKYSPELGMEKFSIPNKWFKKTDVTILTNNPSQEICSEIFKNDEVLFCSHPEISQPVSSFDKEILVSPTSSTRTLLTKNLSYNFFIKTDLDKLHFKFIRRLKGSSVQHSLLINQELSNFVDSYNPIHFSFFPESIGVIYGDQTVGSGVIYREFTPYPFSTKIRYYIPYFSLYSHDTRQKGDLPLQIQLLELNKEGNKLKVFLETIIRPLISSWYEVLTKTGILLELHGQNTLIELGEDGNLGRIICRDFQGTYSDPIFRKNLGLASLKKHVIGDEDGISREEQYSHVYDDMIGNLLLKRMVQTFVEFYKEYDFVYVCSKISSLFKSITKFELDSLFPTTVYKFPKGPLEDNHVRFVDSGEKPLFR